MSGSATATFLSTSPARGTTLPELSGGAAQRDISIHVPREGDDFAPNADPPFKQHFYPRPPRGGRLEYFCCFHSYLRISIHVPREGDDASAHAETDSA